MVSNASGQLSASLGMQQNKFAAAVFRPGRFIVFGIHRTVLAVADGLNPRRIHTQLGQRLAQRQRPAFAERPVVFLRATLVAIAFNPQQGAWIFAQGIGNRTAALSKAKCAV